MQVSRDSCEIIQSHKRAKALPLILIINIFNVWILIVAALLLDVLSEIIEN